MRLPDFTLPIEDRNAADFWLDEWWDRYHRTKDEAFKESAQAMQRYIDRHFDEDDFDA